MNWNKFDNLSSLINDTPLLEISLKYKDTQRKIYAKAEYYSFTGSIKDRIAYHIMRQSYEAGLLKEGDSLAEASSGNTGIAFAALGAYLGNPVHIFMPDWMSRERVKLLESLCAVLHPVSKEEGGFKGALEAAQKFGEENKAFMPRQFANPLNPDAHYRTSGQEILRQMKGLGKLPDGIVAGVGTGGTIMGIKKALREFYPDCRAFPLEPALAPALSAGGPVRGSHRIHGIGDGMIPDLVKLDQLDDIICVDDGDAINMARKIALQLGLGVGISSGANLIGAIKAQDMLKNKEAVIITVFPDDNKKYLSTDLMEDQAQKPHHISKDVDLVGFRSIR